MQKSAFMILIILFLCGSILAGCGSESTASPTSDSSPYQFRSDQLEQYVIVYQTRNPDFADLARELADHLLEKYDAFVPIVKDSDSQPADYEILLGDTNRTESVSQVMSYAITVGQGQFALHAGGSYSARQAMDFLYQSVFNGQEVVLDPGTYYETSFLASPNTADETSTARIMSANILADAFADSSYQSAFFRGEIFAGMLATYTPDVLGLQEADKNWNDALSYYLPKLEKAHNLPYAQHLNTYENKVNYTSLLYRSDKFRIDTDGVHVFSWWTDKAFFHNYHMRNISWACVTPLNDTSKSFIVANTHWSYRTEHADGKTSLKNADTPIRENELRLQCKEETNTFLTSLREAYPETPIFLTGDFNTSLPFFTESGWTPAGFQILSEEAKAQGTALSLVPGLGHFDHIFGAGSYSIDIFKFFMDGDSHSLLTDHPFVYADLTF